jgi:large subunit ribosomal protein L46
VAIIKSSSTLVHHLINFFTFFPLPQPATPLHSACVLERLPVVMPAPPAWEIEYAEWQEALMARKLKTVPPALANERRGAEEPGAGPSPEERWRPASLETAADRSGDRTTTRRRLDQRVFMLAKRSGGSGGWELPAVALGPEETTRAGAERALREALGEGGFEPYFVGNAPAGHVGMASKGGSVFFHRCQLITGVPALAADAPWAEVVWAAKDELEEYIKDPETLELLQKML